MNRQQRRQQARRTNADSRANVGTQRQPPLPEANFARDLKIAKEIHNSGDLKTAALHYRQILLRQPDNYQALRLLAMLAYQGGDYEGAVRLIPMALELSPDDPLALDVLGDALKKLGRLDEATVACRRAFEIDPNYAPAHCSLGGLSLAHGNYDEAAAHYRAALARAPDYREARSNLMMAMNYNPRFTAEEIFAESRRWDAIHAVPRSARIGPLHNRPDRERRLRVGYVSPDFHTHPVSFFVEPLLTSHDRGSVEVFCYADVPRPDQITLRLQALSDVWRFTVGVTDAELADQIREDRIDVLVDLAGHTANNRLLAFAERPAPVQVTWLGYGATTGLTEMDYRLTDAVVDPVEEAGEFFSETLVRLPHAFFCYAPPAEAPEVAPLPALSNGHVTFGTFNNPSKIGPEVIEVWARVLRKTPGSRFLLKSQTLANAKARQRYLDLFSAHGIGAERLDLLPSTVKHSEYLGTYERIDIALDPFPYNGGNTSLEAAWMGVPIIALRGDRCVSRMGASVLTQLGLTDLVAENPEAYVEIATDLASDLARLTDLRRELRPRMAASPLCDAKTFAREVEAAYRHMWRRWCDGESRPLDTTTTCKASR